MYTRFCSSVLFPLHERAKGHGSVALRRELERSQWWSREQIEAAQSGTTRKRISRRNLGTVAVEVPPLSEQEQIPKQFAYKILKKLQKSDLVSIQRGAEGGCHLQTGLDQITLFRLMQAMDEDSAVSSCMKPGYECQWCKSHNDAVCRAHIHLTAIQQKLNEELDAYPLQEILFGP